MPNYLFRNDGDAGFREVGLPSGVAVSVDGRVQGGMGAAFGDADNDGDLDLLVTNFVDDYNTLYRNDGNGVFTDDTRQTGMAVPALPYVGWGVAFADLDLDGRLDIPVANGHLYPQLDRSAAAAPPAPGAGLLGLFEAASAPVVPRGRGYLQRNLLFQQVAGGRYAEIGDEAGEGFRLGDSLSSRGLAAGDVDNDGLLDLVITHLDDRPSLLRNRSRPGNWLTLDLRGTISNRSAIGAAVLVRAGGRQLRRDVGSGGSYQSQNDRRVHFGLGTATRVDELTIRWPSGKVETRRDVETNRIVVVTEAE